MCTDDPEAMASKTGHSSAPVRAVSQTELEHCILPLNTINNNKSLASLKHSPNETVNILLNLDP